MNSDYDYWISRPYERNDNCVVESTFTIHPDDQSIVDYAIRYTKANYLDLVRRKAVYVLVAAGIVKNDTTVTSIPGSEQLLENTMEHINTKLDQLGFGDIEVYWPGIIITMPNQVIDGIDWGVLYPHADNGGLEVRLNFYGYQPHETAGSVLWWDPNDLTHCPFCGDPIYEGVLNHKHRIENHKQPDWDTIPDPMHAIGTNNKNVWLRTNIAHAVVNGKKPRIVPTLRLRNKLTHDEFNHTGTWNRILEFINGN